MLDDFFFQSEYDGIHLIEDKGSRGRSVETWIAFDENQVKSADRNNGFFSRNDNNIYHSIREDTGARQAERAAESVRGDAELYA